MSQHPSLKIDSAGKRHRNVLKRYERIKKLKKNDAWDETKDSVYGLPKVKSQKIKAKSSKAEAKEGEEGASPDAPEAKTASQKTESQKPESKGKK